MDKEILEEVLKNSARCSSIKSIIDIKSECTVPKGENYTSTILKLTLKIVLENGRITTRSFIAKKENTGGAVDQLSKDYNLFKMEVSIYTKILREMDNLMEEFQDTEGPLWCKFIHYNQAESIIILEDLEASGFKTVDRTELQDLDHAKLALRGFGRYHAMSKVLEERGLISKDDYKPHAIMYDDVYIRNFSYGGNKALIKGIRSSWGEEWADIAEKLSQMPFHEFSNRVKSCGNFDDNIFKCLNHGDCWNSNMMFKHNWEGRPIEIRLIDFQIPHYNSPCADVTLFMYTSIKPEVRRQNYKHLIELYHESLTSSLDRFGYKGSKPSLAEISNVMEGLSFFGLSYFTGCFPTITTKTTDAMDLDEVFKSNGEEGMDKEVLAVVLKNSLRKSSVKRIIDIKSEPAVPKGENYSSTVLKLTAKVVLGNGRIATKSFIVKKVNPGRTAEQLKIDLSLFKWEASVYTNILKEMDYLMEEFQDTEGPLWCKFIHYNHVDPIIVLEDLKESGFRTVKRTEMQDIEHARLVLRSLGRYHAMAKVLEMRGIISIDSYNPYACLYDEFFIKATSYGGNQCLINGIREFWGKEWAETADELSKITFEEYLRRTKISGTFDDDTFKCLNHGDCWNTNMMFKYNWEGRPIKVRFIDYQQPHYNSPCVDLTYYLYTSIKPEVRRQNYRSLIELYHETLSTSLERFGYVGSKPSLGDIEKNMERLSFFGITFFMGCFPIMISTRTDALDFDKLMETGGKEGINLSIYNEDGIIEKMGKDIKKLLQLIRCD